MKIYALLTFFFISTAATAGVFDFSQTEKGAPVGILIAEPVERLSVVTLATTGYREMFVGRRFTVGPVDVTTYVGGEYLAGLGIKPRARLVTSVRKGSLSLLSIIEAGGHTGNYHKLVLGYSPIDKLSFSAVRLNGKNGGRIDFNLGVANPYVEVVDHKVTAGIVIVF